MSLQTAMDKKPTLLIPHVLHPKPVRGRRLFYLIPPGYAIKLWLFLLLATSFTACSTLNQAAKYELSDGVYQFKKGGNKARKVFLQVKEDSLVIFRMQEQNPAFADTTQPLVLELSEREKKGKKNYLIFKQPSFDIDVLTILFKYRPKEEDAPRQLNTDYNAAMFIGYRADSYSVNYNPTPLNTLKRNTRHLGYSIGLFSGIGSTMIAPWFTDDQVQAEYDGMVFINGIAANIGYNELTFGLGIGVDYLLDSNRKYWVYQGDPWIGFTLGLNLN